MGIAIPLLLAACGATAGVGVGVGVGGDPVATSITRYQITDDTDKISLQIEVNNGVVEVVPNGTKVDPERLEWIERGDDRVLILRDEAGVEVKRFDLPGAPGIGRFIGAAAAPSAPPAPNAPRWVGNIGVGGGGAVVGRGLARVASPPVPPVLVVEEPRAMIGIFLGEPSDDVRAVLGLGDQPVIMIDGVMDGMPAAEVGLKKFDIIVEAEGRKGVGPDAFREIMSKKQPGDALSVVVLRAGERKKFVVRLSAPQATEAPRAERVLPGFRIEEDEAENPIFEFPRFLRGGAGQAGQDLRAKAMEQIQRVLGELDVRLGDRAEAQIEDALKSLEEGVRGMLPGGIGILNRQGGGGFGLRLDNDDRVWIEDQQSAAEDLRAQAAAQAKRLLETQRDGLRRAESELREQSDVLEEKVKELEARLQERWEAMESRLMRAIENRERGRRGDD